MITRLTALTLFLCANCAWAETRYVTEELIVGVYAAADLQGERLAQIRSADAVELLGSEGDAAQIRTEDGVEGWVKASYLETEAPLAPQLASARAELEKLRKAETAATRVDPKPLQKEIADLRTALEAANRRTSEVQAESPNVRREDEEPIEAAAPVRNQPLRTGLLMLLVAVVAGGAGFAAGYRTLERRVLAKYGGLKVY